MNESAVELTLDDVDAFISLIDNTGWRQIVVCAENLRIILSMDSDLSGLASESAGMLEQIAAQGEDADALVTIVRAPHLGTVMFHPVEGAELPGVGDRINAGQVIVALRVLDQVRPVRAPIDGVLSELLMHDGDLLEYDQPLLSITAGA